MKKDPTLIKEQYKMTSKTLRESKEEIHSKFDRMISFILQHIVMNVFRIFFYFWYFAFQIFAFPLQILIACCRRIKNDILSLNSDFIEDYDDELEHDAPKSSILCCKHAQLKKEKAHSLRKELLQLRIQKQLHLMQGGDLTGLDQSLHVAKRLQVVLDLDNTLIHSIKKEPSPGDTHYFEIVDYQGSENEVIYVYKRPHLDHFLSELTQFADVHLFTASNREYASQIISAIDPKSLIFKQQYFRDVIIIVSHFQNCSKDKEKNLLYKDLTIIQDDLSNIIMIDDSQITYERNQLNTFKIQYWTKAQKDDNCLRACLSLIQQLRLADNVQNELPSLQTLNKTWLPFDF